MADETVISTPCAGCGEMFSYVRARAKPRKWCSEACRVRAYYRTNPAKKDEQAAKSRARSAALYQPASPVEHQCVVCHERFFARPNALVCSKACRSRRHYLIGVRTGSRSKNREEWRARQRAAGRSTGKWTDSGRASYQRRRAVKKATAAETIRPTEIFERDGWRCQLCGLKVDPSLVHPHPMSASLDHIVPLSIDGGPGHVRSNVQLAHLRCNVRKGAKVDGDGEQLKLIG